MLKVFLFLLFGVHFLQAELEDHFKKALEKSGSHAIKNIDFIYMINLDQRPEKFLSSLQQLAPFGINPYRFSAVNGWELPPEEIDELGVKYESWMNGGRWASCYPIEGSEDYSHELVNIIGKTYFSHCLSLGAIGIVLSHLSILQDAYDSGYETIWVMEDDIQVVRDPHILSELIDKLDSLVGKEGWDILFTDRDTKDNQGNHVPCASFAWRPNFVPINQHRFLEKQQVSEDFMRIGARYGAYSMIVRRSGMKKLLTFLKSHGVFLPYDMEYTLPQNIQLYSVMDEVVSTQIRALSDNGSPNYKNKNLP